MRIQTETKLLERIRRNCPSVSNPCRHCNILTCTFYTVFHHAALEVEETAQKYLKLY